MSLNSRLFHTTVTLKRLIRTANEVGDFTSSYNVIASGIPAIIRPAKVSIYTQDRSGRGDDRSQGKQFDYDAHGYIDYDSSAVPLNNDVVVDEAQSAKTYDVVGVELQYRANSLTSQCHHVKMMLKVTGDTDS